MSRRCARNYDFSCPFHIGARCINKDWFSLPMPVVWEIMQTQLHFISHAFEIRILGFVLMQNHFHLLARAPLGNLSPAIAWLLRETSRELTFSSQRINHTYSARFFRSNIQSLHHYLNNYKYLCRNPVKAGLCRDVLDYEYSTLRGTLGLDRLLIPIEEDTVLFADVEGTLKWLNQKPEESDWEAVRKGLRRRIFTLAKDRSTKRDHALESRLL